ncbi:transposase [Patescibacteria group bacterium]|nr:transposase [Patescibacteria group bacterium]
MLTYKRKLILTKEQEQQINSWIGACRVVYNMGLEIRITTYKNLKKSVSKFELMRQLTDIKDIEWIKDVPAQSLQNAIERLDISYKNFYKTCHSGGGFPKFANKKKYKSILFKEVSLIGNNFIRLPKIGNIKIFKDALIQGTPKIAIIKKEPTGYFICIVCDNINKNIQNPDESQVIGLDMGVKHFCIDSDENFYTNPRIFQQYERKLRIENRSLARKKKGSNSWKRQCRRLALLHHKISNVRKDYLHKLSTDFAKNYNTVFTEDLKIVNMSKRAKLKQDENGKFLPNHQAQKSGLNKAILDCGWGLFRDMLEYKTNVIRVNPKYTSQTCNECGYKDSENRISQSKFECKCCGYTSNADFNAAKNILGEGIALKRQREALVCA